MYKNYFDIIPQFLHKEKRVKKIESAQEQLNNWFEEEKRANGLVDIKFFPGNTSQSSMESFSKCVLSALEAESQGRYDILREER